MLEQLVACRCTGDAHTWLAERSTSKAAAWQSSIRVLASSTVCLAWP